MTWNVVILVHFGGQILSDNDRQQVPPHLDLCSSRVKVEDKVNMNIAIQDMKLVIKIIPYLLLAGYVEWLTYLLERLRNGTALKHSHLIPFLHLSNLEIFF